MGRTGAAGIANFLSPYADPEYCKRAIAHAKVIGQHPQSFPDTHGSPPMGMAITALAANVEPDSFRKLMDANRWWFTMAQCTDGSFYYQPNRDNAGYDSDARMTASSVVAFIFTIPKRNLVITGKQGPSSSPRSSRDPDPRCSANVGTVVLLRRFPQSDRCPPTERQPYVGEPLRRLAPDSTAKPFMRQKRFGCGRSPSQGSRIRQNSDRRSLPKPPSALATPPSRRRLGDTGTAFATAVYC